MINQFNTKKTPPKTKPKTKLTKKQQPSLFNMSVLWHNEELNKHQSKHKEREKKAKWMEQEKPCRGKQEEANPSN